jgi:hypothetical protein
MGQVNSITLGAFLSLVAVAIYVAFTYVFRTTKLTLVPGSASPHWFYGHLRALNKEEDPSSLRQRWIDEYGPVVRYTGLLSVCPYLSFGYI